MIVHNFNKVIQVAGIIDQQEADLLVSLGIDYLGFPLRLPVNREDLSEQEAAQIIKKLPSNNHGVAITYSNTADEAIEICNKLNCKIIQLHGPIDLSEILKIKSIDPTISIIKSLVITEGNINELEKNIIEMQSSVDAFITDTYDPVTKASGATGKTHNWEISKRLVELSSKPVILAGGLNPNNVYNGIMQVRPAGVDVHTGVEDISGRKSIKLVTQFIEQTRKAFREIENEDQRIS